MLAEEHQMNEIQKSDFKIDRLGECRINTPMTVRQFINENDSVLFHQYLTNITPFLAEGNVPPSFEVAGPRKKIYFDPSKLRCGIVTCGGLCPGLNDVIRAVVLSLFYHYGVKNVLGFRYGFAGLTHCCGHSIIDLNPDTVRDIHKNGGTILGSSRGPQDVSEMVDTLERTNIGILFTIGGDGTLKGAMAIAGEIKKRKLKISVIGIPKTIDNDISLVDASFGFDTAVSEARTAIYSAHNEAVGARNGIGLVKLMGRASGFIAANATLSNNDVNFCLIPEKSFSLEGFLKVLKQRLEYRGHAVIVVGEGAGQDLVGFEGGKDPSGNIRFGDVGIFLRDNIRKFFQNGDIQIDLKYIDPSYTIRSMPANPRDSSFCLLLGHNAVHAGMTGRTNMLVGYWKKEFTHVPIRPAVSGPKRIDPDGRFWSTVLSCTGQPREM
jgi:6-phosphofructokinase 1